MVLDHRQKHHFNLKCKSKGCKAKLNLKPDNSISCLDESRKQITTDLKNAKSWNTQYYQTLLYSASAKELLQ